MSRSRLSGVLLSALFVVASCGKSSKDRGGVMVTIATDETTTIDELQARVMFGGEVLHSMTVGVPGEKPLPTTLAIVSNGDETAAVEIMVVGWLADEPVDRRDAIVTQVPTDRVARLPIVLSARCSGRVALSDDGDAVSTCPDQKTCSPETGDCVDVYIASASLTSYAPGDENDMGMTSSGGGADGSGEAGSPGQSGTSGSTGSGGMSGGVGGNGAAAGSGGAGSAVTAGTSGSGGGGGSGGSVSGKTQCDDALDNDQDGFIDGFDPECKSRADNDEGSFATGQPGNSVDPQRQDCFFDTNGGRGDDQCDYSPQCMAGELPPDDELCDVSQACFDFCSVRTPNGCDCFGCCSVMLAGSLKDVWINEPCTMADLANETACMPCVKQPFCENTLEPCELALGMLVEELPATCTDTPAYQCDGLTRCGPDVGDCGADQYCSGGCCIVDTSLP